MPIFFSDAWSDWALATSTGLLLRTAMVVLKPLG